MFKTVVTELSSDSSKMKWHVRVENFLGRTSSSSYFAGDYTVTYKAGGKEYSENLYKNSETISAGSYVSLGYHDFEIDGNPNSSTISVEGIMSTTNFTPSYASANGSVTLSQLHQYPNPTLGDIVELNSKLITAGIANDYFVNSLSKKSFSIGGETFDNATISKYIVHNGNNLTESNYTPVIIDFSKTPNTFPGKVLALLERRYSHFNGDVTKGLSFICCELIDYNGEELRRCVLGLAKAKKCDEAFIKWINEACHFTSTLVDRIVPGYPRDEIKEITEELGYIDNNIVKGEIFHLWVLQKESHIEKVFPCDKVDLNVLQLIKELDPKYWFIENPRGGMRKMIWMRDLPRYTLTYCQYDLDKPVSERRMKPTDIWTNHPDPDFKPMCKNGSPCHAAAPRGSKTGTQGLKNAKERSVIPRALCEHIVEICEKEVK